MTEFSKLLVVAHVFILKRGKNLRLLIFEMLLICLLTLDFDGEPVKVLETGAKTNNGATPGFVDEGGDPERNMSLQISK